LVVVIILATKITVHVVSRENAMIKMMPSVYPSMETRQVGPHPDRNTIVMRILLLLLPLLPPPLRIPQPYVHPSPTKKLAVP
jgi:hypothetical protein